MRIYTLRVDRLFKPDQQNFVSPPHNEQWGVEQSFEAWLQAHPDLLTDDPDEANYDYLPLWWNRFYVNNAWGEELQAELQAEIDRHINPNRPAFTIAEYDIDAVQPHLNLWGMTVFTASRINETDIDIPLLCTPHVVEGPAPRKRWLASFIGNLDTWGIRSGMRDELGDRRDCYLEHDQRGTAFFVNLMRESLVGLAPRGHGGQSFRFYEAMQLGTVPCYISDLDCRPFPDVIDWDTCSLYLPSPHGLRDLLTGIPKRRLAEMGACAARVYDEHLRYGQWCRYVIEALERL